MTNYEYSFKNRTAKQPKYTLFCLEVKRSVMWTNNRALAEAKKREAEASGLHITIYVNEEED